MNSNKPLLKTMGELFEEEVKFYSSEKKVRVGSKLDNYMTTKKRDTTTGFKKRLKSIMLELGYEDAIKPVYDFIEKELDQVRHDNELVGTKSFLKDEEYVWYRCSRCGSRSVWDFDYPAPLLLRYQPLARKMKEFYYPRYD